MQHDDEPSRQVTEVKSAEPSTLFRAFFKDE